MNASGTEHPSRNEGLKWALVAVLVGVLGLVLFFQSGPDVPGDHEPAAVAASGAQTPSPAPSDTKPPGDAAPDAADSSRQWPEFQLKEILALDPFALSEELDRYLHPEKQGSQQSVGAMADAKSAEEIANERRKRLEQALADLMNRKISAVYTSRKGKSALIGSQWIQEGDVLDGLRIVEIDPNGVTVEISDAD